MYDKLVSCVFVSDVYSQMKITLSKSICCALITDIITLCSVCNK